MRVLHVNSENTWRGGEQQMAYLIEELNQRGVYNKVLCRENSAFEKYAKKNKIDYKTTRFKGLKISDAYQLRLFAKDVDLIHVHTANAHTVAYLSAKLFGNKKPICVSKRTDFPVKSPSKYNHAQIKKVLCVSKAISRITKAGINDQNKVEVVYSGINPARFSGEQLSLKQKLNIPEQKILIGNTSALAPQKDYFTFLQVAKQLSEYEFVIMGEGPLQREIQEFAQQLALKNIHFTGFLDNVHEYLASLDLFLITSQTEGLGTSILDAMTCKVPVVATDAGGISEIVIDGETGSLHAVKDVSGLTEAVKRLTQSSELRAKLTARAYDNVQQNFTKNQTAERTYALYREMLI